MKKTFISFVVAGMAALVMTACGGNKSEKAEAPAEGEQTEQTAEEEITKEPQKVETVGQVYQLAVPAGWESKQYASEMIVKKDAKELNFKDNNGNIEDWVANLNADNKLEDAVVCGRTWQVYQNENNFKFIYLTQIGEHVLRVGSNVEDPKDQEVMMALCGVNEYSM